MLTSFRNPNVITYLSDLGSEVVYFHVLSSPRAHIKVLRGKKVGIATAWSVVTFIIMRKRVKNLKQIRKLSIIETM